MKIRHTLPALAELDAILSGIASSSPQGARRVGARIRATEDMLAIFPRTGRVTRLSWLRRIRIGRYPSLMFYECTEGAVVVHALRHAARDPASMPDRSRPSCRA